MTVLVVGGGGREHALCWRLAQDAEIHCTPGNPGIAKVGTCHSAAHPEAVVQLAVDLAPDLVLIGPEAPLIDGLADQLRARGFDVLGPGREGARLEASKAFSKQLMLEAGVPTARFETF